MRPPPGFSPFPGSVAQQQKALAAQAAGAFPFQLCVVQRSKGKRGKAGRLAGVAPIPAPSGHTQRHRLSRGGDRQLNRALHTIALHRRQHDPTTRDYIAKRISESKSTREATRLLKRNLARHLYRLLEQQPAMSLTGHRSFTPEHWPRPVPNVSERLPDGAVGSA